MNQTDTKKRTFRCTENEWKQISDNAKEAGMSANTYLRKRALSPQDERVLSPKEDLKTLKREIENLLLSQPKSSKNEDSMEAILSEIKLLRLDIYHCHFRRKT